MKSLYVVLLACLAITSSVFAQHKAPDPAYQFIQSKNLIQVKNYYLLTLFNELEGVNMLLANDRELTNITKQKLSALQNCLEKCDNNNLCYIENIKFSPAEINKVGNRLTALYSSDNALGKLVTSHLIPSGCYILYQSSSPSQLLIKALEQDANALNE